MKQLVNLTFLLITLSINAVAQTEFKISGTQGYEKIPTFATVEPSEAVTLDKAKQLFDEIKTKSGIEFRYSYGGCEDRAHAISLLLNEKGIKTRKIWNFARHYVSLFNARQNLNIKDRTEVKDKVEWGFHVAVILSVKDSNQVNSLVFDPAVADELLPIKKWLDIQNAPNSYYIFTDSKWFSFWTINGLKFGLAGEPMPSNFPSLLTGDFKMNEGYNLNQMEVEEGLAVNQVGMQIISDIYKKESEPANKREAFKELVTNISALTCFLRNECNKPNERNTYNKISTGVLEQYPDDAQKYQSIFTEIRKSWQTRLNKIRNMNLAN